MNRTEFNQCLQMLCSSDMNTFEDGYDWMSDHIDEYLDELISIMQKERNPEMRGRLIELIGESSSPKIVDYLKLELFHEDSEVRSWAYATLLYLEDPKAHDIAYQYKKQNPQDQFLR